MRAFFQIAPALCQKFLCRFSIFNSAEITRTEEAEALYEATEGDQHYEDQSPYESTGYEYSEEAQEEEAYEYETEAYEEGAYEYETESDWTTVDHLEPEPGKFVFPSLFPSPHIVRRGRGLVRDVRQVNDFKLLIFFAEFIILPLSTLWRRK